MLYFQIAIQRQKAAFPPNFVHSLDSSHMMMTAIACKEAGLHFAGLFLIDMRNCFLLQATYIERYISCGTGVRDRFPGELVRI